MNVISKIVIGIVHLSPPLTWYSRNILIFKALLPLLLRSWRMIHLTSWRRHMVIVWASDWVSISLEWHLYISKFIWIWNLRIEHLSVILINVLVVEILIRRLQIYIDGIIWIRMNHFFLFRILFGEFSWRFQIWNDWVLDSTSLIVFCLMR